MAPRTFRKFQYSDYPMVNKFARTDVPFDKIKWGGTLRNVTSYILSPRGAAELIHYIGSVGMRRPPEQYVVGLIPILDGVYFCDPAVADFH